MTARCSLCGATGPQVVLVFDPGKPAVAMCSTTDDNVINACADRQLATTEEKQ